MTIVDIYCRVSTDPQEDNTSLDEQEAAGREYCRDNGLIIGIVHREVFSGYQYRERKELEVMRGRYQNGKIQGVVCRTLDRLSRSQVHNAILMEEMEHYGVTLYCVKENIDDTPMGKFIRMVLAFVAEMEREKIMDRTMTGRTNAVKQGNMAAVSTHKLRYGFMWGDAEKTLVVLNEEEAAVLRWMARQYVEGVGAMTLEQQLNDRGIPGPKGGPWRACTILRILQDRKITGTNAQVFVNKAPRYKTHHDTIDIPDGTYPQIISTELFDKIQQRMSMNKLHASRGSKNPEEFLLRAGFVRCSVCSWGMGAKTDKRHDTYIYRCRKHGSIVSKALDAAIWARVELLAGHVTLMEEAIELAKNDNKLKNDLAAIDASIQRYEQQANNFFKDLQDPELTGDGRAVIRRQWNDALQMVRCLQGEKEQLKAGLMDREREEEAYEEILGWCREVKDARGELSYQRKRDFLAMLGVVVIVHYPEWVNAGSTYDMKVRLPALQELISLPGVAEPCDANMEL